MNLVYSYASCVVRFIRNHQMTSLQQYSVKQAPPTAFYIPNFITQEEGTLLWNHIYAAPKPKWTQLSNRRLQNWGGVPHAKGMVQQKLPEWLQKWVDKVTQLNLFDDHHIPNHVLINEYCPGQGIMPHLDGPLYHSIIATISLGSTTSLDFYHPIKEGETTVASLESRYLSSMFLEPCSLLLLTDDLYNKYLHGIAERSSDVINESIFNATQLSYPSHSTVQRTTRVSLTIRHTPVLFKLK